MTIELSSRFGRAIVALVAVTALIATGCTHGALASSPSTPPSPDPGPRSSISAMASDPLQGIWQTGRLTSSDVAAAFVAAGGSRSAGAAFFSQLGGGAKRTAVISIEFQDGAFTEFEAADGGSPREAYLAAYDVATPSTMVLTSTNLGDVCVGTYTFRITGQFLRLRPSPQCQAHDGVFNTTLFASFPFTHSEENGRILFGRFDPSLGDTVTFTANPDGSDEQQLFTGASESPHWSPDGSEIVLLACLTPPNCDTAAVIVNPDTGSFRGLKMPDPDLFTPCFIWSPDASRLACDGFSDADPSRNGIYTIRTSDGSGLKRITSNPTGDDNPIDYSPNGTQIVFDRTDPTRPSRANQALFIVNVDGSGLRRITPWGFSDDDGGWSPDGTKIVFGTRSALYVVHPDGSHLTKIPLATAGHADAFDAAWSPDGTKIVFSLGVGSGLADIYTANVDGTDLQQVTNDSSREEKADWGPHPSTPGTDG